MQEFLELRYHGEDKLFVPVERLDLVLEVHSSGKQAGAGSPRRHDVGEGEDARQEGDARHGGGAVEALRRSACHAGPRLQPRLALAGRVRRRFEWDLTPDQITAVTDIKRDMQSATPMDRLLCGDVGYGKTEVAMRAAFKAVMDGKQVAVLAPTTVLAFQHLETLRRRFAGVPCAQSTWSAASSQARK